MGHIIVNMICVIVKANTGIEQIKLHIEAIIGCGDSSALVVGKRFRNKDSKLIK